MLSGAETRAARLASGSRGLETRWVVEQNLPTHVRTAFRQQHVANISVRKLRMSSSYHLMGGAQFTQAGAWECGLCGPDRSAEMRCM